MAYLSVSVITELGDVRYVPARISETGFLHDSQVMVSFGKGVVSLPMSEARQLLERLLDVINEHGDDNTITRDVA